MTRAERASVAATRATPSARRDVLSRPEPHPPRRVPAEGALGRLGRARLAGVAATRRAPLHAGADHLLQLRVGLRPARLRRPRDARGPQVRGQPRASRARAGATARRARRRSTRSHDPDRILYPLQARRRARRGPLGAGVAGTRRSTTSPARIRARDRRGPAERGHVPRRPPRRGRLHRARARGVGRRRPQLAHQHLLERAAGPATTTGWGSTARAPTTRTPTSSC